MCKKRELWKVTSKELPKVKRNCPKCKEKREFINSGKFRVNANGKSIDVWLIFRCELCSTTWNMTVYERKGADSFDPDEYRGFLENEYCLAEAYGRNPKLFSDNKALAVLEEKEYTVERGESGRKGEVEGVKEIEFLVPFPMMLRVDILLADPLGISRSAVKKLCKEGDIFKLDGPGSGKVRGEAAKAGHGTVGRERVRTGLVIGIKQRS